MKRIVILLLFLILPLGGLVGKNIPKAKLSSFLYECRYEPGVELVRLGSLPTMFVKAMVRKGLKEEMDDPEAQAVLRVIGGIKKISVLDYEDAPAETKELITQRLDYIFRDVDLLMETKGDGESMSMYGVCSDDGDKVRDFVLYSPSDCALICLFGTISMKDLNVMAANND